MVTLTARISGVFSRRWAMEVGFVTRRRNRRCFVELRLGQGAFMGGQVRAALAARGANAFVLLCARRSNNNGL